MIEGLVRGAVRERFPHLTDAEVDEAVEGASWSDGEVRDGTLHVSCSVRLPPVWEGVLKVVPK